MRIGKYLLLSAVILGVSTPVSIFADELPSTTVANGSSEAPDLSATNTFSLADPNIITGTKGMASGNWEFNSTTGVLTIHGGTFESRTGISSWDNSFSSSVKSIILDGNVSLGTSALNLFANLYSLTEIKGSLNTSNTTDFRQMFMNDKSLISLDTSNWDTSNVTTMGEMFSGASALPYLDVSKWNTSKVTAMYALFLGDESLSSLDVSHWDTSNVESMDSLFADTKNTILDVSNWNTSNVLNMSQMFGENNLLTSLDVSKWDTHKVEDMSDMFIRTSSLSSLDVSHWDTGNVTDMTNMFVDAGASDLDVSQWNTSSVTSMQSMFDREKNLTDLDVSQWNTANVTTMLHLFEDTNIRKLDLSNWNTRKLRQPFDMNDMFHNMKNLRELTLGSDFVFKDGSGAILDDMAQSNEYTGKWQDVGNGSVVAPLGNHIWSSSELIANYNPATDAGTYVWQPTVAQAGDVTVKYQDEAGNEISDVETISGLIGEKYASKQKEVPGYSFKTINGEASGTLNDQEREVIYVYTKDNVTSGSTSDTNKTTITSGDSVKANELSQNTILPMENKFSSRNDRVLPETSSEGSFWLTVIGLTLVGSLGGRYLITRKHQ